MINLRKLNNKTWFLLGGLLLFACLLFLAYYTLMRISSVEGTIYYDEQVDLPEGSRLVIQLRSVNEQDQFGELIAEQIILNPGQPPFVFELDYDADDLNEQGNYALTAHIYDKSGEELFINDAPYNKIAKGDLTEITLNLIKAQVGQGQQEPLIPQEQQGNQEIRTETNSPIIPAVKVVPKSPETEEQQTGIISVNVYYDANYILPADAKLVIYLTDHGTLTESGNLIIAEETVLNPGQPPRQINLSYNPNEVSADHFYLFSVGIYRPDEKALLVNSTFGSELPGDQLSDEIDIHLITVFPSELPSSQELDDSVRGKITYDNKYDLPAGSELVIQISDVSYQDSPSMVINEITIPSPGDSPIAFEIGYDSDDISERNTYSVSAAIYNAEKQLLLINDTAYEVITRGNPNRVNMPLVATRHLLGSN